MVTGSMEVKVCFSKVKVSFNLGKVRCFLCRSYFGINYNNR